MVVVVRTEDAPTKPSPETTSDTGSMPGERDHHLITPLPHASHQPLTSLEAHGTRGILTEQTDMTTDPETGSQKTRNKNPGTSSGQKQFLLNSDAESKQIQTSVQEY